MFLRQRILFLIVMLVLVRSISQSVIYGFSFEFCFTLVQQEGLFFLKGCKKTWSSQVCETLSGQYFKISTMTSQFSKFLLTLKALFVFDSKEGTQLAF